MTLLLVRVGCTQATGPPGPGVAVDDRSSVPGVIRMAVGRPARDLHNRVPSRGRPAAGRAGESGYANATVLAPATISSTTLAAPMIVVPLTSWSSPMARGFVQAPQSQTTPPLSTNSS